MKSLLRNKITKTIAFVLMLLCVAAFTSYGVTLAKYVRENSYNPSFDNSDGVWECYWSALDSVKCFTKEEAAEKLNKLGWVSYYIMWDDGSVITNIDSNSAPEEGIAFMLFKASQSYEEAERNARLNAGEAVLQSEDDIVLNINRFDGEERHLTKSIYPAFDTIKKAYVGMNEDKFIEMKTQLDDVKYTVRTLVEKMCGFLLGALIMFAYLIIVSGRKGNDDAVHSAKGDGVYTEIWLVLTIVAQIACFWGVIAGLAGALENLDFELMVILACACSMIFVSVTTFYFMSVARNIKNKSFMQRSFIVVFTKKAWHKLKASTKYFINGKMRKKVLAALVVYSVVIAIAALWGFVPFAVAVCAAGVLLRGITEDIEAIRDGIFQIGSGNTDYKVMHCNNDFLNPCADALNNVNEGIKKSVEREIKAQKLKTELITNVSHDIKTPLTSIISYAALLSEMELSPQEANDYVKIIAQKGERLKRLTADLFDISKAESGNETVEKERLDIALLLKQTLGELNGEIEESSLKFITKIPDEEISVFADGKKLSRVFENLIVNALKYSMVGTRVYISLVKENNKVRIEFKNVSGEALDFDPQEITERFVRGDKNRSTSGSGLGLAIAKSYTQLCGGSFEIKIDADLFTASMEFLSA